MIKTTVAISIMTKLCVVTLIISILAPQLVNATEDDYQLKSAQHKSLLVAVGCFWCGEQAFEQYAPGVVEAVSGYAGTDGIENPTYRNHPGHFEVVLVEYDPTKTSYQVLIDYAWKNSDPFNGNGQFCDYGPSYKPAIFYDNDEEREIAERYVQETVLPNYPTWKEKDLQIPLLPRPTFWTAETYHQNYYIKNPGDYGYYKNACGRPQRLKDVWGKDVYDCYHNLDSSCFENVTNASGDVVEAELNTKGAEEPEAALLPRKYWITIGAIGTALVVIMVSFLVVKKRGEDNKSKQSMELKQLN